MKQTKPAQAMELRSLSPVFGGPVRCGLTMMARLVATRMRRARNEAQLRKMVLPMFAAFCLGFALGDACYPVVGRQVLLGGPLLSLRNAVLENYRSPVFRFGPWDTLLSLGCAALCLVSVAQEQRRTSRSLSLPESRFYRLALLGLGASCLIAWPGRGELATRISHWLAALAGVGVLAAAWPCWRPRRRIQAAALLVAGCGLAVCVAYQVDYWLLRDGSSRSYR
jgi:hypothetical protein